jgi:23S rRNA (cytidine1920-2'-O)/16S rRNA (cytidine1409-2'-O)-methyltransferase
MVERGIVSSRSQAENYIKLGRVKVGKNIIKKAAWRVTDEDEISLESERYVSRAALKLASVSADFNLTFQDRLVLDVGSSTGGFTDYALQHGAAKVVAVDVGTKQLHPSLRGDRRIELHEKTDIRVFKTNQSFDIVLIDVSFISIRKALPAISKFLSPRSQVVAMVKPQFEAGARQLNKGVVKNDTMRRKILQGFEQWVKDNGFLLVEKKDAEVAGSKGNRERFYLLKLKREMTSPSYN